MKKIAVLVVFAMITIPAMWAQTGNRYALVIGNAEYADQRLLNLPHAKNDAKDITTALRNLGYQVDLQFNLSFSEMNDAIKALAKQLRENELNEGFFWYAGHAVQIDGKNYLLPEDFNIDDEPDQNNSELLSNLLEKTLKRAENKVNVLILDACRNAPVKGTKTASSGIDNLPPNMFVMFSTAPNTRASDGTSGERNSPFTQAFLKYIESPASVERMALEVEKETMRLTNYTQWPSPKGAIREDYSLNPSGVQLEAIGPDATGTTDTATGSLQITTVTSGMGRIIGASADELFDTPTRSKRFDKIAIGSYQVIMYYRDGTTEEKTIVIRQFETTKVDFRYRPPNPAARLNTLGFSLGSSFTAPLLTGGVQGTFAPFDYIFMEIGLDVGVFGIDMTEHFSLYPCVHVNFFYPFGNSGIGWYIGGGGGYLLANYQFPEGELSLNMWAVDFVTGFILLDFFTVSYTLRTDFSTFGSKAAVGFVHRFK